MQYRLDNLSFSSLLPNYINVANASGVISLSGTYDDGTTTNFSITLALSGQQTFSDVYATQSTNNLKIQLNNNAAAGVIYDPVDTEFVQNSVVYSGGNVVVTITVNNNTGSSITLVPQTYTVEVVEYMLPV